MKTYSRKNSSYLKKAFISSNFNEMCRLCLSEMNMGLLPIIQDCQVHYQEWIRYSVDVLIEEGDGLPPNICEECLGLVEQTYLFKKKCKASDSKLREHLELLELEDCKVIDRGFKDLSDDLFTKKQVNENKIDESSAIDSGGTNTKTDKDCLKETNRESCSADSGEINFESGAMDSQRGNDELTLHKDEGKNKESVNKQETLEIQHQNVNKTEVTTNTNFEAKEILVINQVKRYILKGEKHSDDQEEDLSVCEVVPLEVRTEDVVVLSDDESPKSPSCFSFECKDQNGHLTLSESSSSNKSGTRIEEIYQLWENEETEETQAVEKNEEEPMVLNVLWEENYGNNEKKQNFGTLEVDIDQNGAVQMQKVFTNKSLIQIVETLPESKQFKCIACEEHYPIYSQLKEHIAKTHKEVTDPIYCEICCKSFTCSNSLKRHMSIHTGYKPFTCKICKRKFSQGSILKRHILTHEPLKPFNCHVCKKSYTQKINLLSHLKSHGFQMATESFQCKVCKKSFAYQSGLSRHINLHKGVRFMCVDCKKSFGDASALARHVKALHKRKS